MSLVHAHYNHFLHPHRTGPPKKGLYIWRSATQDENLYNSHKFPSRFCMSERNLITNFQWLQNEPQLHSRGRGQASAQDWCRPRPAPRLVERSPALDSATPTTCGDGRWLLMLTQYTILSPLLHLHLNLWLAHMGHVMGVVEGGCALLSPGKSLLACADGVLVAVVSSARPARHQPPPTWASHAATTPGAAQWSQLTTLYHIWNNHNYLNTDSDLFSYLNFLSLKSVFY